MSVNMCVCILATMVNQTTYHSVLCTIELGLGKDAPTDRKTILPVADIKGRDGRMVGHLAAGGERETFEQQCERKRCQIPSGMY